LPTIVPSCKEKLNHSAHNLHIKEKRIHQRGCPPESRLGRKNLTTQLAIYISKEKKEYTREVAHQSPVLLSWKEKLYPSAHNLHITEKKSRGCPPESRLGRKNFTTPLTIYTSKEKGIH